MTLAKIVKHGSYAEIPQAPAGARHSPDEMTAALVAAVGRDDAGVAKLLLDAGADPDRVLEDDWTPIHFAVEHERLDMIRLLVRNGADVNLRSRNGVTPLQHAVDVEGDAPSQLGEAARADMTSLLLELEADPAIKDPSGRTALDVARDYDHRAAITLLQSRSAR